jgi:two-component system CheB/CheR fusion protein
MIDDHDDDAPGDPGHREADAREFLPLLEKLNAEHGFDFREYKTPSLARRIRRRMRQVQAASVDDYARQLESTPGEYDALLDVLLVNVTHFFRDPDVWAVLRKRILPALLEAHQPPRILRIWSAGCSSGEEAFTAAICVAECLGREASTFDVKIYATDLDEDALATARAALYRVDALKDVPPELVSRHFQKEGQLYRVRREIRKWTIFGRHDLTRDPPLPHIDLLLCRNVLIYFDVSLQRRLVPRFAYALRPGGFLVLGRAESLLAAPPFEPFDFKCRIFQRGNLPDRARLSSDEFVPPGFVRQARADARVAFRFHTIVDALPAAVMAIDHDDTIVTWNAGAESLFGIPQTVAIGKKFRDLDISYRVDGLRSAIEDAKRGDGLARLPPVVFKDRKGVDVHVELSLGRIANEDDRVGVVVTALDVTDVAALRTELQRVHEQATTANEELQSTNEELETTNEELQSTNEELETTNEELQSTNEELESTVEELQCTNAELGTMNAELENRSADLDRSDRYHRLVLDALAEAVILLDPGLEVTHWNHAAVRLWGLKPEDGLGRPVANLPVPELARSAAAAARTAVETRRTTTVPAVPYALPGGERRSAVVHVVPLLAGDGAPVGVAVIASPTDTPGDGG